MNLDELIETPRPQLKVKLPRKMQFLFRPSRYKVAKGGRGSAKSWSVARALVMKAHEDQRRILCGRELQNSITESVHHLLESQINKLKLDKYFNVQNTSITHENGSEFIFSGIKNNITKIKSMEDIDIAWIEEAEKISKRSLEVLIPTIRKPKSELWFTFNPDEETDPVYQHFVVNTPPDCQLVTINWEDNPYFPEELRREKDYLYSVDPDAAAHVWGGELRKNGEAQIFRNKYSIRDFTPVFGTDFDDWDGPYFGADWGFSQDPTCIVKMWIHKRKLYIEYDTGGIGVENDDIGPMFKTVPQVDDGYVIYADNARPETINHVAKKGGLHIVGVEKWQGSVEDGIQFLRSFEEIIIHSRCRHMQEEARLYSYKVDRLTGDVTTVIVDKHNHRWDAIRYGLWKLIKRKRSMYDDDVL